MRFIVLALALFGCAFAAHMDAPERLPTKTSEIAKVIAENLPAGASFDEATLKIHPVKLDTGIYYVNFVIPKIDIDQPRSAAYPETHGSVYFNIQIRPMCSWEAIGVCSGFPLSIEYDVNAYIYRQTGAIWKPWMEKIEKQVKAPLTLKVQTLLSTL